MRPDLLLLLAAFGSDASGDVDGDGTTNVSDLLALLAGFGDECIRGEDDFGTATFYFGTSIPTNANADAILDDGTGFAANRDGGLSYGWDCEGDTSVNYAGGRRGLGRDGGLGINHFDRNGDCGTTSDPGRVNWQIAVPNGAYDGVLKATSTTPEALMPDTAVLCSRSHRRLWRVRGPDGPRRHYGRRQVRGGGRGHMPGPRRGRHRLHVLGPGRRI